MRNRSWRRAQRERAIARARRHMKDNGYFYNRYRVWDKAQMEVNLRRNATTPHPCSSHCCGNPRKWFGDLTLQEQRAEDWEKDQRECYEARDHHDLDQ